MDDHFNLIKIYDNHTPEETHDFAWKVLSNSQFPFLIIVFHDLVVE